MTDYVNSKLATWLKIDETRRLMLRYDAELALFIAELHLQATNGRQVCYEGRSSDAFRAIEYVVNHAPLVQHE